MVRLASALEAGREERYSAMCLACNVWLVVCWVRLGSVLGVARWALRVVRWALRVGCWVLGVGIDVSVAAAAALIRQ